MVNEANGIETERTKSERFPLPKMDHELNVLTLLQDVFKCSKHEKQLDVLTRCVSCITSCEQSNIMHLLSIEEFRRDLMRTIDLAVMPTYEVKEHFSYENDFHMYSETIYCVLTIFNHIMHILIYKNCENTMTTKDAEHFDEREKMEQTQVNQDTMIFFLPKLLLLIGAHRNCQMQSSRKLNDLSCQMLDKLLLYFSYESPNEFFSMVYSDVSSVKIKGKKVTLFEAVLSHCLAPLSKDLWLQNPVLCNSFHWLILQMKLPHLSNSIELIISVALNFLEDYQTANKVRAISCLHHLIKNTSNEEMRWLNRAEVVYDKLKNQMYSKEAAVVECLLPCLFDVLRILESPPELDRHHYVLDALLRDTEGENLLVLRKIYVHNLTILVQQVGIYSVHHLKTLIKIAGNYLEVDDGFDKVSARPDTLKLLESIIRVAWPRIQQHADAILKLVLNFIADISCAKLQGNNTSAVQSDLATQAIHCLILLSEVCPNVLPYLKVALREGMHSVENNSNLFNILKKLLDQLDTVS